MKKIVVFVYDIVKKYMLTQAIDTGNQEFVDQLKAAFQSVEDAWVKINQVGK